MAYENEWFDNAAAAMIQTGFENPVFTAEMAWAKIEKPDPPMMLGNVVKFLRAQGVIEKVEPGRAARNEHGNRVCKWRLTEASMSNRFFRAQNRKTMTCA